MDDSLDMLKKHYRKLSNNKIEYLARHAQHIAQEEIIQLLILEISESKLDNNLLNGLMLSEKFDTHTMRALFFEKYDSMPCPVCAKNNKMNLITRLKPLLIDSNSVHYFMACDSCSRKKRFKRSLQRLISLEIRPAK